MSENLLKRDHIHFFNPYFWARRLLAQSVLTCLCYLCYRLPGSKNHVIMWRFLELYFRMTFAFRNIYQQQTLRPQRDFVADLRSFTAWVTVSDRLCYRTVAMEWTGCYREMRPINLRANHRVSQTWSGLTESPHCILGHRRLIRFDSVRLERSNAPVMHTHTRTLSRLAEHYLESPYVLLSFGFI